MANALTLCRIAASPFIVWLLATASATTADARHAWALGVFIAAALTDFVDGQVARRTNTITEFGRVVDPLADRLLVISTLVILMVRGFLPLWMGLLIVGRDGFMLLGATAAGIKDTGNIKVHWTGKVATGLLFEAICWFIYFNTSSHVNWVGLAFFLPGVAFSYLSGYIYMQRGIRLVRQQSKEAGPVTEEA
jgi:CDP-diacylglycerol--glycerol-3-phosphate 3-phosphatidyltransferase